MNPIFSLGISSLWDELRHMPAGGVWWINTDRQQDAISLANQTIATQASDANVAVICLGETPDKIIKLTGNHGPEKINLFSMTDSKNSLYFFRRDLLCSLNPQNFLFILLCTHPHNVWENISNEDLLDWIKKQHKWTGRYKCTLLVINSGSNNDPLFSFLMTEYRSLFGLVSLRSQGSGHLYDVAFWCNEKGVSARQQIALQYAEHHWQVSHHQAATIQPRNDEKRILSHVAVLEGAPPLSEHWSVFDTNEALFNEARTAQAATIIFSLTQNSQTEALARNIHTLRRQRGSALKIIVRENRAGMRAVDERLLQSCGANLVIPWNAPLSRSLALIESVQEHQFHRHVPEDISRLLTMTQPLKLRGYQKWQTFCNAVDKVLNNSLLPANGKGVMVALRPVPGLRLEQAMTLCRPNRMGDIMTIGDNRLVLFLSFCRVHDLDTALNHIFPLPTSDIFSNRIVWFKDDQIAGEILQMRQLTPAQWGTPLSEVNDDKSVVSAGHDGRVWRRIPEPVRLLDETAEPLS